MVWLHRGITMAENIHWNDYYAQHGIWGAYASFALGKIGKGAGVVIGDVQPPDRALYIGYQSDNEKPCLLPFVGDARRGPGSTAYTAKEEERSNSYTQFTSEQMERTVGLGTESWKAGLLTFTINSFFGSIPDPALVNSNQFRSAVCPSLLLSLEFDNTQGDDQLVGYFGMQGVNRPLSDSTDGRLLGMASKTLYGFASLHCEAVQEVLDWNSVDAAFNGTMVLRRLSTEGGLRFLVPAHTKKTFTIALGVFESGVVTSLVPMQRYYACLFKNLEDVLEYSLELSASRIQSAVAMDALAEQIPLDAYQSLLFCNAVHAYQASSELLMDNSGRPIFLVNEGEYQMMNTLDLTVDQAFWELAFSPWTVRNELEFLHERSMYTDAYGIAFSHDQGVADGFTAEGHSVYELPNLLDCFSYMSYEETINWMLSACLYIHQTNDKKWASRYGKVLKDGLLSLSNRDQNGDGIMDCDSSRCEDGSEITTYDSLDVSLGQARNNLYLAVKAWGAFVSLACFFKTTKDTASQVLANEMAEKIAKTVSSYYLEDEGYIPAVFEGGNRSMIIPAIEGLIYPYFTGAPEQVALEGVNKEFLALLRKHLLTVLKPGRCIDDVSGGWKLSSTSRNTWLSKIFLNQFVAEQILHVTGDLVHRDKEHASHLFSGNSFFAMTDQVDASTGKDLGSRLYPRLVTSILWVLPYHSFKNLSLPNTGEPEVN